jgi:hypothetical protein
MKNASNMEVSPFKRILVVGRTGSGKTAQIWSLPGKKFGYIFDPNASSTLVGCDMDYEEFMPDVTEIDATLKGFNKGSKSDTLRSTSKREPKIYLNWVEDLNAKADKGFFKAYDWLVFDSATFLSKATMDRQLYINNRYGDVEELGDYRVVGSKLADVFSTIATLPINIYMTGHISSFQDDKTKKIEVQLNLPGKARVIFPMIFTDLWLAHTEEGSKGGIEYKVRTRPEPRGLQDVRCSIPGLNIVEDVTLSRLSNDVAGKEGIGKLIRRTQDAIHQRSAGRREGAQSSP